MRIPKLLEPHIFLESNKHFMVNFLSPKISAIFVQRSQSKALDRAFVELHTFFRKNNSNDPSAGSPTDTMLRLSHSSDDLVYKTF